MKFYPIQQMITAGIILLISACNTASTTKTQPKVIIKEETVKYVSDSVTMQGFLAYDESIKTKRPIVIIIPEWWGLNDYAKSRARQLADLGYLAFAMDMYGNGETADNPTRAGELAGPFYKNPGMAKAHFDAALNEMKKHELADVSKIAAIGYCFGGGMVLNIARLGEDLKGAVSFHGSLMGVSADKNTLKADILVLHGEADQFVKAEEVASFRHELDSIGAKYTFVGYPNATHAFTNPNATAMGEKFSMPIAYNAEADTASWIEMNKFFEKIFR